MTQNKLVRVTTALHTELWLLPPAVHKTLTDIVMAHAQGGKAEIEQHAKAMGMEAKPKRREFEIYEKTAVINVEGVIGRKFSESLYSSGVTSIDVLDRMLNTIEIDDQIDSVLLVFDSPGGLAQGVPEVAQRIKALSDKKPVMAYIDGCCGSAAYWMASQCNAIYSMQSGDVGSVGAYIAILDQSRAAEMAGLRMEVFKSGKHKGMGIPGTSLTDEQRALLQERVDKLGANFRDTVKSTRKDVSQETMQGQSFTAVDALEKKLIDSISDFGAALKDVATLAKNKNNKTAGR